MKVFVFDFDHTIVKGHTHNAISLSKREDAEQPEYVNSSWGVVRDFPTIGSESDWKRIFETLSEQGHYLSIASFNAYGSIIPEFLSKIGLSEDIIQHIDIIAKFPKNPKTANKNGYICEAYSNAKLHYPKEDLDEVILIDDSKKNIQAAKELGYTTILADNLGSHLKQLIENYIAPAVNRHLKPAVLESEALSSDQLQPATQAKGEQKITEDANFTKNSALVSELKAKIGKQSEAERQHSEGLVNSEESLVLSQIATLEQRKRQYLEKLNQAISENEKGSIDDYRDELSAIEISLATKKNYLKRNEASSLEQPLDQSNAPETAEVNRTTVTVAKDVTRGRRLENQPSQKLEKIVSLPAIDDNSSGSEAPLKTINIFELIEERRKQIFESWNQPLAATEEHKPHEQKEQPTQALQSALAASHLHDPLVDNRINRLEDLVGSPKKPEQKAVENRPKGAVRKQVHFTSSTIERDDLKEEKESLQKQQTSNLKGIGAVRKKPMAFQSDILSSKEQQHQQSSTPKLSTARQPHKQLLGHQVGYISSTLFSSAYQSPKPKEQKEKLDKSESSRNQTIKNSRA